MPLAWLYGLGVFVRNELFEMKVLTSKSYPIPIINVGNITVGGTGKTPHTEYLIRLLQKEFHVAVLSRGYKRKSKGFQLATLDTPVEVIGDEPFQMKQKFPEITVAVDANRRNGIEQILQRVPQVDVILLDDAFQHRYVKPGINILLTDYHRLICDDALLPAGRLREPASGKSRANMVVVTKCPADIKPIHFRILQKSLGLYPYQKLFFSTLRYGNLTQVDTREEVALSSLPIGQKLLLLTGIANPTPLVQHLEQYRCPITHLSYGDHHFFTSKEVEQINRTFREMGSDTLVVTTEKDSARLRTLSGLDDALRSRLYTLPIEIEFLQDNEYSFKDKIIDYVRKNSKNSILVKR
jgi:tetraacyldisaccharide 4'-kinase